MNKLLAVVFAVLTGCTTTTTKQTNIAHKENKPILFTHVVDLSRSTNQLATYSDSSVARHIYNTLAASCPSNSPSAIKVIYISATSKDEEVVTIPVVALDTVCIDTIRNSYQRNKALRSNKKIKARYYKEAKVNIQTYLAAINKPHDQNGSNVNDALSLVAVTLQQGNFQDHKRIVAIFSDLEHYTGKKYDDKLHSVQLNTSTILCIRPTLNEEQLQRVFSQHVSVLTSAEDVLPFLKSNSSN